MKFFVVSDVHSFYTELLEALDAAGFDESNPEHHLVVCGDLFDRGSESKELLEYIMSLPNKTLVRGNHEDLFMQMIKRGYPCSHDKSNGTFRTLMSLTPAVSGFELKCAVAEVLTREYFNSLVDYLETENYIFVHGWIPCEKIIEDNLSAFGMERVYEYNPDWRNCNDVEWESARWTNGIKRAYEGIVESGKTIVCGHWHCSYGHFLDSIKTDKPVSEFEADAKWEPWYHEGCIAIDRCTAHTRKVNVLVLEDKFL